jgi:hypothetical protein
MIIDIVCSAVLYVVLRMLYKIGERLHRVSVLYRMFAAVTVCLLGVFVIDYFVNIVRLTYLFYTTAEVATALKWFGAMLSFALFYRVYVVFDEYLEVTETMNFASAAIRFGNYFRERDVDTQERIGTHRMKTIYAEVEGRPFREENIATSFDRTPKTISPVPVEALQGSTEKPPPEYGNEMASVRRGARTDVSVSFRFSLMGNRSHPFLPLMDRFVIDPSSNQLTGCILFPPEQTVPAERTADKDRLVGHLYVALQILAGLPWFRFYERHAPVIIMTVLQQSFNDAAALQERSILRFGISLERLRGRGTRITTADDLRNIASIIFY